MSNHGAFWAQDDPVQYIPGTNRPIKPPSSPATTWVTNDNYTSERRDQYGQVVTMYTIGALAEATGKSVKTLRRWITLGTIPDSAMRTRPIQKTLGDAGRRLWTRQQIESIVAIELEEGVHHLHKDQKGAWVRFRNRVWQVWKDNDWL